MPRYWLRVNGRLFQNVSNYLSINSGWSREKKLSHEQNYLVLKSCFVRKRYLLRKNLSPEKKLLPDKKLCCEKAKLSDGLWCFACADTFSCRDNSSYRLNTRVRCASGNVFIPKEKHHFLAIFNPPKTSFLSGCLASQISNPYLGFYYYKTKIHTCCICVTSLYCVQSHDS